MTLDCSTCPVRSQAACASLSEDDRSELVKRGRTIDLKRGEQLFAAGDESSACATLTEGALKISTVDAEGVESILALIHPAGFVGEMFSPFEHHDVTAIADSRLCLFSKTDLDRAMSEHPELGMALFRRSQEDLHQARSLLDISRRKSATARVAGTFLAFAEAASHSPCHPATTFDLPLTRGELAAMLGLTIETVSRQISKLEEMGIIHRRGSRGLELIDPDRLTELQD